MWCALCECYGMRVDTRRHPPLIGVGCSDSGHQAFTSAFFLLSPLAGPQKCILNVKNSDFVISCSKMLLNLGHTCFGFSYWNM